MALKIGGVEVSGPAEEVVVFPRIKGPEIVFKARAVQDMRPFEDLCPRPTAPKRLEAGGFKVNDQDKNYLEALEEHAERRFAYICIKSLEPSEIEWQKVDFNNPATWSEWTKELSEAGISNNEINHVIRCIMGANALDNQKLEAARDVFLRGQAILEAKSSGPDTEPQSTQSGEPANGSE